MKYINFLIISILLLPGIVFANKTEDMTVIARKYMGEKIQIHHGIFKIRFLNTKPIIFFYEHPEKAKSSDKVVTGILLIPVKNNTYKKVKIFTFPQEGGMPVIASVFIANADSDKPKELIILCKWEMNHRALGTRGTYFTTYVFDNKVKNSKLVRLEKMTNKIGQGLDGIQNGEEVTFRIKNAKKIKQRLKSLGY